MIYFMQATDGGPIKIGHSTRVRERLWTLKSEHGKGLRVLGVRDGALPEEQDLHARFASIRLDGELFAPTPELLAFIAEECRPWDGTDGAPPREAPISFRFDDQTIRALDAISKQEGVTKTEVVHWAIWLVARQMGCLDASEAAKPPHPKLG